MPSPFPGIDPYLENPAIWGSVHNKLISITQEFLAGLLEPKYYALEEERVYISDPLDPGYQVIAPDVFVSEQPAVPFLQLATKSQGVLTAPTQQVTLLETEIRDYYLVIRNKLTHKVVTIIEFLLPVNKTPSARGREEFIKKRREILASDVHWLEIDLLRAGQRDPWAAGKSDYYVLLSRAEKRNRADLWLFTLRQPLPVLPVPLQPPDPDIPLPLGEILQAVYDRGRYYNIIDYSQPPTPPLAEEAAVWAAGLLLRG